MKQTGIHILDFNDKIIDYISRDDGALLNAVMSINADEKSETFDFTVLNERADNLRERNRIIAQDSNGLYREFIITHVVDNFDGTTEIESNASYLEDIGSSKPIKPGKYSAYSTTQALNETLRNTGWELSDDTEHGGMRTTSWTSYVTPYELINQLCTTYSMVADYYIELSSHTVEHRYVSLKKPVSLFKGKEITKGKDLTGMTRTVDMSEVRTALYAVGPEKEKGERLEKIVTDDDAQMQFGLPGRYLWSVYEPESDDENMTLERLTTLAKTELNKRNKSAISYEISSTDIHKFYKDIIISLHDTVRVKDRDFRPPLYLDAEVIAIDYDLLNDESTYKFGNVVEYEESKLRDAFNKRFDAINKKLNDSFTNINTIVNDRIAGELEYYERKIIKSTTPPDNPVEDMLWYDTSNPNVAVLKRYHNGEWRNETAKNVEQLGGMTREQVFYNSLTNTFQNLNIQHSKLLEEVYQLLNSEYLVDNDIRNAVNNAVNNTTNIYDQIKSNLDTMTGDTATIGKLVDTQALFLKYRERLQDLYKAMRNAQVAVEDRLALLQSQYTDEKFNDAMNEVAKTLPNGRWDSENQQLYADIPNKEELSNLKQTLQDYYDGNIKELEGRLNNSVDSKMKVAKDEISANVKSVENKVDGVQTRVNTTESNISTLKGQISLMAKSDDVSQKLSDVDGRLTPLETTVQSNKATLDILPTQIDSKVSKQDYTLDKDNIVQRLDSADSERKQLSNEITDKVTITKFESGMAEAKNYTDNIKKETENYTDNQINNLDIGSENLLLDSERRNDFSTYPGYVYIKYYLSHPLEVGKTYTLKADIVTTDERQSGRTSVYPYNPSGIRDIVDIKDGKITYSFTAQVESTEFLIYKDVAGQSNVDLDVTIEKAILVEGDKVTGWAPANEDVKKDIQQAETNAKNYTDDYKRSNDVAMTKLETSITQNGDKIALKVDEQKFNASQKTLSQVISEISATTKGINLSYDENGNIQSYTMDRNGIQLRGDKIDITVNKDFNVMASRVDNKVGKDEVINRLNLSPEGLDIDVNKVGIRGGDSTNYIYLSQDKIEMAGTFQRTFRGNTQKDNVFMRAQGGYLRFRNNNQNRSLYYSDFGISTYIDGDSSEASGTLQFFDYAYSPTNSVRGVTLNSAGGAIALNSERNRIVLDANATVNIESETSSVYIRPMKNNRAGTNEFRFWTKLNDSVADTDGVLSYGTITELVEKAPASYSFGSGIRFDKSPKSRYIYATDKDGNIGTGDFYARNLLGDWWAKNNNLYALVDPKEGKLRITDYNGYNNGSPKYKDLQCDDIQANSVRVNTGQNFYIGVSTNELWVTNNLRYNGGNTGFKPVRASDFIKASSAEFKHDIKKWDYDALNVISNELQLYSYKYNDDEKETIHHGPVIGDGYDIPVEFVFNSGVNTNEMLSWALRAIQQLNEKINTLEEQLNE